LVEHAAGFDAAGVLEVYPELYCEASVLVLVLCWRCYFGLFFFFRFFFFFGLFSRFSSRLFSRLYSRLFWFSSRLTRGFFFFWFYWFFRLTRWLVSRLLSWFFCRFLLLFLEPPSFSTGWFRTAIASIRHRRIGGVIRKIRLVRFIGIFLLDPICGIAEREASFFSAYREVRVVFTGDTVPSVLFVVSGKGRGYENSVFLVYSVSSVVFSVELGESFSIEVFLSEFIPEQVRNSRVVRSWQEVASPGTCIQMGNIIVNILMVEVIVLPVLNIVNLALKVISEVELGAGSLTLQGDCGPSLGNRVEKVTLGVNFKNVALRVVDPQSDVDPLIIRYENTSGAFLIVGLLSEKVSSQLVLVAQVESKDL